jgi:hypothetical protein
VRSATASGNVCPIVEKFLTMSKRKGKAGDAITRVITDFAGSSYWMIVAEFAIRT